MIFSIFKIFISNLFSFGGAFGEIKKGPKGIAKIIGIGLLVVFCSFSFISMTLMSTYNIYTFYKSMDMPQMTVFFLMASCVMVLCFFGFASIAGNYITGSGEEQLLAMPIKPFDLFGAKFLVSLVTDAILGVVILATGSIFYGILEGLVRNPLFYVGLLVNIVAIPLISISVIYTLLVLVFYFFPVLRKKSLLSLIATVFIILFIFCFSLMSNMQNQLIQFTESVSSIKFLNFLSSSLTGNFLAILFMIGLGAICVFVILPVIAPLYVKSLNGFTDTKSKKINKDEAKELISKAKVQSHFGALLIRDIRNLNREPAFFANGPLFVFLMPAIFVISFSVGFIGEGGAMNELFEVIRNEFVSMDPGLYETIKYFVALAVGLFSVFMGNGTGISATAISREGKNLSNLKAMPIDIADLLKAKIVHSMIYCVLGCLIMTIMLIVGVLIIQIPFSVFDILQIFVLAMILNLSISFLLVLIEMFLDTIKPKLNWENPNACVKQNMNTMIAMLISILIIGIVAVLGIFVIPRESVGILILSAVFLIPCAPIGSGYFKYAPKKIKRM